MGIFQSKQPEKRYCISVNIPTSDCARVRGLGRRYGLTTDEDQTDEKVDMTGIQRDPDDPNEIPMILFLHGDKVAMRNFIDNCRTKFDRMVLSTPKETLFTIIEKQNEWPHAVSKVLK